MGKNCGGTYFWCVKFVLLLLFTAMIKKIPILQLSIPREKWERKENDTLESGQCVWLVMPKGSTKTLLRLIEIRKLSFIFLVYLSSKVHSTNNKCKKIETTFYYKILSKGQPYIAADELNSFCTLFCKLHRKIQFQRLPELKFKLGC